MRISTCLLRLVGALVLEICIVHVNSPNCSNIQHVVRSIGGVVEKSSRVGREQQVAMEMAVYNFCRMKHTTCSCPVLHINDSQANSVQSVYEVIDLIWSKQFQAIIGTISLREATFVAEFDKTTKTIPIISLTPTPTSSIPQLAAQPSSFLEMSHDLTTHMECIAAILGHFSWRKVITPNYENHSTLNSSTSPLISLSDALQLRMKENRVFILLASSLRSRVLLFVKAKQLGMMEESYVWIVSDNIASLLDSVDQSVVGYNQTFHRYW